MRWVKRCGAIALAVAIVVGLGYAWRGSGFADIIGPPGGFSVDEGNRGEGDSAGESGAAVAGSEEREDRGPGHGKGQGMGLGQGAGGGGEARHSADLSWSAAADFGETLLPFAALVGGIVLIDLGRKRRARTLRLRMLAGAEAG